MRPEDGAGTLTRKGWAFVVPLFFASGAVSLVYQILWMKELGLLFGNTAQATATTLAAFFLGLALGGWVGGGLAARSDRPLRLYGLLELGIAASALLYFGLFAAYTGIFPALFRTFGDRPLLLVLVKFGLGVLVLAPAAFFMGTTLPVLGQHVVRRRERLGRAGAALYAVNTLGAAAGAYLAGFHLPRLVGYDRTYALAILMNVVLGTLAILVGRRERLASGALPGEAPQRAPAAVASSDVAGAAMEAAGAAEAITPARIRSLAALTGFVTLALEVLWTHMFAQVLHNSVYTFSIILITFLLALAAGSGLAHLLSRRGASGAATVCVLLAAGGILAGLTPNLFGALTGGLRYLGAGQGWGAYQRQVFLLAAEALFLPTLLLGTVFPYLLKLSEASVRSPGRTIGNLVAVNTAAAIVGSLAAGFLLLGTVGLWAGIRVIGAVALLGIPLAAAGAAWARGLPLLPLAVVFLGLAVSPLGRPPLVQVDAGNERVLRVWEGSAGVVAVVQDPEGLRIKVDNHYGLGGSASEEYERRQGLLPLLLHPDPKEIFYLGLGTGITASAALATDADRITVCELVPDAITAAREYFGPYTAGLFGDPRVRLLGEDGRTFLRATDERFDVIVSDLFVPWKAGVGGLYTREHFQAVRDHLKPGGVFAQWLPLFQLSREEFDIIAHTLNSVFPQVTLWRGDLNVPTPIVALIARSARTPFDPEAVKLRLSRTPDPLVLIQYDETPDRLLDSFLLGYCGNVGAERARFAGAPVNTDDRPRIEYLAPVTQRRALSGAGGWLVREPLLELFDQLRELPPDRDPYLVRLTDEERTYPQVAYLIYKIKVERALEHMQAADDARRELEELLGRR